LTHAISVVDVETARWRQKEKKEKKKKKKNQYMMATQTHVVRLGKKKFSFFRVSTLKRTFSAQKSRENHSKTKFLPRSHGVVATLLVRVMRAGVEE
jgi:hypothetical protein